MGTTSLRGGGLVCVVRTFQMRVICQPSQAEGEPISQLQRLKATDRGVANHKAFPLPGGRRQTKQMTDQHTVGASVGHEGHAIAWFFDMPNRKLMISTVNAPLCEKIIGSLVDAFGEITDGLATF